MRKSSQCQHGMNNRLVERKNSVTHLSGVQDVAVWGDLDLLLAAADQRGRDEGQGVRIKRGGTGISAASQNTQGTLGCQQDRVNRAITRAKAERSHQSGKGRSERGGMRRHNVSHSQSSAPLEPPCTTYQEPRTTHHRTWGSSGSP